MKSDYKKYSLEKLEEWMHDAISAAEASPEEIYGTLKKVVEEQYYHHKHHTSQMYELLALLNGNPKITFNLSDIPSYTYNDTISSFNIDSKGNAISSSCSSNDSSTECKNAWNDFWSCDKESTEEDKELCNEYCEEKPKTYDQMIDSGYEMTGDGFWCTKVNKWVLPVDVCRLSGEYYVLLPDDLLKAVNLKDGDQVEWIDNSDKSFTVRKVNGII